LELLSLFKDADNARTIEDGTVIFDEETPGDVMYVIISGEVDIFANGLLIETLGPGDLLGEMALIDSKPRSASALTRSECRIAAVDEERFLQMVKEKPEFSLHVMRILADRLRRTTAKV
jgi:CRP/FNR family transcriptional regulator, cyclic AMP receptor protein